jgi:hypothetical protein
MLGPTFLFLQLTGDWKRGVMAIVNKGKVLSVEGKVRDTTNRNGKKKADVCQEFGLI